MRKIISIVTAFIAAGAMGNFSVKAVDFNKIPLGFIVDNNVPMDFGGSDYVVETDEDGIELVEAPITAPEVSTTTTIESIVDAVKTAPQIETTISSTTTFTTTTVTTATIVDALVKEIPTEVITGADTEINVKRNGNSLDAKGDDNFISSLLSTIFSTFKS